MSDSRHPFEIIALWSAPRSRSTAFFRMMLERGDMLTLHEPFCNLAGFGETDVGDGRVTSAAELISVMRGLAREQHVFFKDTTDYRHEDVLADQEFLAEAWHIFLLRHPRDIIPSFCALKPDMDVGEAGIANLHRLHEAVQMAGGRSIVIDSDDLVNHPDETVRRYCAAVGVPFIAEALSWRPEDRQEWRRSARWHVDVSRSSAIERTTATYQRTVDNDVRLWAMYEHHLPFYEALWQARLIVAATR